MDEWRGGIVMRGFRQGIRSNCLEDAISHRQYDAGTSDVNDHDSVLRAIPKW